MEQAQGSVDLAAPDGDAAALKELSQALMAIRSEMGKIIVGQEAVIEDLLTVLLCRGHCILEGVPGLAKTLMISTLARTLSLSFSRIQFTPDLMPSDITGTEVIEEDRSSGSRRMRFVAGPIFANVILADEINRTPPKTQSALLEAMQERQVTTGGKTHELPAPFFVLATQNPIEQEGTYPLPEAQLDRFMFKILVGYPSEAEEFAIVKRTTVDDDAQPAQVLSIEQILRVQSTVRRVPCADHVVRYAARLSRMTRKGETAVPDFIESYVAWGAGPRASQNLVLAGKARAVLHGRYHVSIEDIRAVAPPVLRHRLLTNFNAEADGVRSDDIIVKLLDAVPVDSPDDSGSPTAHRVLS